MLISSPSESIFTFSTLLNTAVFYRFNLRPTLSLLFLTHFIKSIMSSFLSTSTACVMVFIFHVTFPIPVTISPTPPVFIMYSLYRLKRPGNKMQPCLTPSFVPWSTCSLASYSVCRSHINTVKCLGISTLPMLFHIFKCCTLSKCCATYKTF